MCTGFEWLMVAATAVQTMGSLSRADDIEQEGQELKEERLRGAETDARRMDLQAEQAAADAVAEREAGEVMASKLRKAGRSQQSEAKAALAASGVEVTAGTPIRISEQIARNVETDALNEILYGERKGKRFDQSSALLHEDARITRETGQRSALAAERTAERQADATRLSAFGSILQGGAQIAGGWKTTAKKPAGAYPYAGDGTVRIA